jgi:hypothetical protein
MKRALSLLASVAAVLVAPPVRAVESPADVETDHVDATDDGGPRAAGVLLHPVSIAMGWLGGEVDVAQSDHVVITVEADARWFFGIHGVRAVLGGLLFLQRFAFRGIYLHPTFEWDRVAAGDAWASALGGGATVGYAWTWVAGATVRLGGGVAYAKGVARDGQAARSIEGLRPEVDADLGWVF